MDAIDICRTPTAKTRVWRQRRARVSTRVGLCMQYAFIIALAKLPRTRSGGERLFRSTPPAPQLLLPLSSHGVPRPRVFLRKRLVRPSLLARTRTCQAATDTR